MDPLENLRWITLFTAAVMTLLFTAVAAGILIAHFSKF